MRGHRTGTRRWAARLGGPCLAAALMGPAPSPAQDAAAEAGPTAIRLVAVGDIMMGTNFPSPAYLNPDLAPGVDLAEVIGADLLALLRSGDVVFGNQEGTLFDGEGQSKTCGNPELCYAFRSPERYAELLRDMGFNVVSLANNHSGDFREAGRSATVAALDRHGIASAGIDVPGRRTAELTLEDGTRIGLAAFAPNRGTVSLNDVSGAARLVGDLAARSDIVVVSFHGGAEGAAHRRVPRRMEMYHGEQRGDVHAFAHAMIDAGADVVLGHGPHVPRAVEIYAERFIAYSLGNFWTYGRFNLRGVNGIAPVVELELGPDGRLRSARILSVRQGGRGVPRIDPDAAALREVETLTALDFPEAGIVFEADGTLRWGRGVDDLPGGS